MAMLARIGQLVLGLYAPAPPVDLRLTDTEIDAAGFTHVNSRVEIDPGRRRILEAFQHRQHALRDRLQQLVGEREISEHEG